MLVLTIFPSFEVNKKKVNSLFMQVQCASSLTDGILLFCSGSNCQRGDVTYVYI